MDWGSESRGFVRMRMTIKLDEMKRGYSNDIVENQLHKVENLERENLLQYNTRKQNNAFHL